MDDVTLTARQLASQRNLYRSIGERSRGGQALEPVDGVLAAVAPAVPERSLFNAVVYEDPQALLAVRDELAGAYEAAGVVSWTVWTRPGDDVAPRALAAAGHDHDAQPMLMAAPLDEMDLEPRRGLDLEPAPTLELVGQVNDEAFGLGAGQGFRALLTGFEDPTWRPYVARVDGAPASSVVAIHHDGDCGIYCVATVPAGRGGGLSSELMRLALRDARDQGCTTTSLESSKAAESLYARLGYRSFGRMGMWGRRRPRR
jgi:GNAT superfamily N-acetyltransferase